MLNENLWSCASGGSIPQTMFAIFPSEVGNGVTIETSPPNLVTTKIITYDLMDGKNDVLYLDWNTDVSSNATTGVSVRIGVPPDQLKSVRLSAWHDVQILDGFTNISELKVLNVSSYGGILRASMTSLSNSTSPNSLILHNSGGKMYVQTNVPVKRSTVDNGGQSWIETPSYNDIYVEDSGSELYIKGDVDVSSNNREGGFKVSDDAQLTVTGTIKGNIDIYDNSIVNAPSCDNVISSGNSTCNAGPQSVDVDVDVDDLSQNNQIPYVLWYDRDRCVVEVSSSYASLYAQQGSYSIVFVIVITITTATVVLFIS